MLKYLFIKIYVRQSLRTSCEPVCNTHFSNNAFCVTLMCTSSLFLLETAPVWNTLPPASVYVMVHAILRMVQIVFVLVQLIFKLVQNYWMEIKISVTVPRSVAK